MISFSSTAKPITWAQRSEAGVVHARLCREQLLPRLAQRLVQRPVGRREKLEAVNGRRLGEFAPDSPLEGAGFEPSVPLAKEGRAQACNSPIEVTRRFCEREPDSGYASGKAENMIA
jgi:hypothetical protein